MNTIYPRVAIIALSAIACFISFQVGRLTCSRIPRNAIHPQSKNFELQADTLSDSQPRRSSLSYVQPESRDQIQANTSIESSTSASPSQSEDPETTTARNMLALIKSTTDEEMKRNYPSLEAMGLTYEQIQLIHTNSQLIHERANQANNATLALSTQRAEHDSAMKNRLSPEQYQAYVNFELSKPYRVELEEDIEPFLAKKGITLSDSREMILSEMIKFNATSLESSHGPYDGNPQPAATFREVLPHYLAEASRLRGATDQFLNSIKQHVAEDAFESIRSYYEIRNRHFEARTKPRNEPRPMSDAEVIEQVSRLKRRQPNP